MGLLTFSEHAGLKLLNVTGLYGTLSMDNKNYLDTVCADGFNLTCVSELRLTKVKILPPFCKTTFCERLFLRFLFDQT